ncbi:class I adenylate-forming enzyme family protein [Nocardioides sp. Iso805N]|uniref:class I adenylate-forming enzyme family protein n=1 Tax=Nocardioides sp. Iso805N TaxID=1283287 RepID=UPI00037E445C|nr:fatty acid--CoA ligase family protein [Nocardioides sp. Iso805N]
MFRERFRDLLAQAPADREAIDFEGQWTSWGTVQSVARSLDNALNERGLGEAARVGLILENRPEHVAALLEILASGRTVVTFSGLQPPARLAADIARAAVPAVVGRPQQLAGEGVREAAGEALVLSLLADRVSASGPIEPVVPTPEDLAPGIAVEMLTSGTTGPPKRVLLRERQFATALATSVPNPPSDGLFRSGTTLVVTPIVHIGGFWGALSPIYAGRKICLLPRFELESWLEAVERHRPRATGLVPAALRTILQAEVPAEKLSSIQVATSGTTFCPPELIDSMLDRYGIRVLPTYGATEFAGAIALWSLPLHEKYWETKKGAAGRPVPGVELRITGPDGNPLPAGEQGLLEVRTAQSPLGADEWQRTSDLAALDEDGFLWIHGRADDAIIRGGFKVHPETVRLALERHPAVREAAVAPWADERLGAVPVAGVELEPGAVAPSPQELRDHCRELLLPYEVPLHVVIVDELPRTPSHKVSRVDLLEQIKTALSSEVAV